MVFGTGGQTHRGIPGWAVIHRIIGSSDHRNLDGIYTDEFLGSLKARNLLWKSFLKYGLWPEINHRNLYGIYTEITSLIKILDQNALEYLAFGKGFIMDRLRLDI